LSLLARDFQYLSSLFSIAVLHNQASVSLKEHLKTIGKISKDHSRSLKRTPPNPTVAESRPVKRPHVLSEDRRPDGGVRPFYWVPYGRRRTTETPMKLPPSRYAVVRQRRQPTKLASTAAPTRQVATPIAVMPSNTTNANTKAGKRDQAIGNTNVGLGEMEWTSESVSPLVWMKVADDDTFVDDEAQDISSPAAESAKAIQADWAKKLAIEISPADKVPQPTQHG
jgi:hypothetical protein